MANEIFTEGQQNDALDRVDGREKVKGAAKYSGDYLLPGLTYAVLVESTIAKGRIMNMDTSKAEIAPGVLAVIHHGNAPAIPGYQTSINPAKTPIGGEPYRIFQNARIYFAGQPIAVVVANTYERAVYAASLVNTAYQKEEHQTSVVANLHKAALPTSPRYANYVRGQANAYATAAVKIESEYTIPIEVHNPMETHTTSALWDGEDKVTVYEKTQGVKSTQRTIMDAFKLTEQNVQVHSDYVGGGFGSALRTWPHTIAAVLAAKKINQPVRLVLSRSQMFTMVGYRPYSKQKIGLGATPDGKLTGLTHEAISETSTYEEFTDRTVDISKIMYACPNVNTSYKIIALDKSTPTWMRGPGEATGAFALECAMDELAYALNIDPLQLRIINHADVDPMRNLPWSGKHLKACYQKGAEAIGWFTRDPRPALMRQGDWQIGYGMGAGCFNANRGRATVRAVLLANGSLLLQSAVSDSGPGTATSMAGIAAEAFGLPAGKIGFELGDSSLPPGPTQGGSTTTSTLGSAVHDACKALQQKMAAVVTSTPGSVLQNAQPADLVFAKGFITLRTDASKRVAYADVVKQAQLTALEVTTESQSGDERSKYSIYSFAVHYVQVLVHQSTGMVRIKQAVTVADAGTIINPKMAASQLMGGVVSGIGMALMEDGVFDHRTGRFVNSNFADYHVPVNADAPPITALFINQPDPVINPIGSKGLGEIANVGFAAAVANAVYHATGKRIRDLPITPDKLLV